MAPFQYFSSMWSLALEGETQGVWFWAAMYAIAACGYSLFFQLRVRSWPSTTGELKQAGVEVFGFRPNDRSDTMYAAKSSYTYGVSDETFEGSRISPWVVLTNVQSLLRSQLSKIQYDASGAVVVFYHPRRPAKSFLVLPGKLGLLVTVVLGLLPLVGYLNRYYG